MLSLESELLDARDRGVFDQGTTARLVTIERGELFSIHFELRLAAYAAVALITTALGIILKNNLDRIGPVAIIAMLALVAAGCYATAFQTKRQGRERSIVGDYVLLLGALLLSADIAYAESQFHLLGTHAAQLLLVITLLHAITAYLLDSRLVLAAALTSFTAWMGAGLPIGLAVFDTTTSYAARGLMAAAAIFVWRMADTKLGRMPQFAEVFDHFAANLAMACALVWCFDREMRWPGALLLAALVAAAVTYGVRTGREAFVLYAVIYGVIGFDGLAAEIIDDGTLIFLWLLVSTPVAIAMLFVIHNRMKVRR